MKIQIVKKGNIKVKPYGVCPFGRPYILVKFG